MEVPKAPRQSIAHDPRLTASMYAFPSKQAAQTWWLALDHGVRRPADSIIRRCAPPQPAPACRHDRPPVPHPDHRTRPLQRKRRQVMLCLSGPDRTAGGWSRSPGETWPGSSSATYCSGAPGRPGGSSRPGRHGDQAARIATRDHDLTTAFALAVDTVSSRSGTRNLLPSAVISWTTAGRHWCRCGRVVLALL